MTPVGSAARLICSLLSCPSIYSSSHTHKLAGVLCRVLIEIIKHLSWSNCHCSEYINRVNYHKRTGEASFLEEWILSKASMADPYYFLSRVLKFIIYFVTVEPSRRQDLPRMPHAAPCAGGLPLVR